jgi:hypothetical protein
LKRNLRSNVGDCAASMDASTPAYDAAQTIPVRSRKVSLSNQSPPPATSSASRSASNAAAIASWHVISIPATMRASMPYSATRSNAPRVEATRRLFSGLPSGTSVTVFVPSELTVTVRRRGFRARTDWTASSDSARISGSPLSSVLTLVRRSKTRSRTGMPAAMPVTRVEFQPGARSASRSSGVGAPGRDARERGDAASAAADAAVRTTYSRW